MLSISKKSGPEGKVANTLLPALKVDNFSKKYHGRTNYAVQGISFVVNQGEFHGFIGANGAGKTTTIKSLIGAYAKFEGQVSFFGLKNSTKEAKKKIGYIPEVTNFPKKMSAYSYIRYMANLGGLSWKESAVFARTKLEQVGLKHLMNRSPNTFSSGQKKKVLLAQALVANPDILIMDEPAANLDPQARTEFFNVLKDLQSQGKAIFISSHILAELEKYISHVTILDAGKLVYSGHVSEITKAQKNEYIISLETKEDAKKVMDYFSKAKVSAKITGENTIVFELKEKSDILKFNKYLIDQKIFFESLSANKKSLDDVYNSYVKVGSLDTKGEDLMMRRENEVKNG